MFYSHHLLARKAPMGQIWMAATLHAKINRRKLDKLNIIKICEEILNPSVPMALRLSGILMGGVVIVYERKVKLLYDDVTRLLVEINEAWKVKPVKDPTILPKGRSKAKKEVITLPEKQDTDIGDYDQSLRYSNATTVTGFQQTTYFAMRLDDFDEICTDNPGEELREQAHQADAADITLCERFDLYQSNGDMYNGFERFDIEGDEETQVNFTSMENMQIPSTLVPSPTLEKGSIAPVDVEERKQKVHAYSQSDIAKEEFQLRKNQCELGAANAAKRKTRRSILIDNEQTFLPGHVYQSWLQDTSNIISSRGKKRKHRHIISTMKVARLMDLPPVVVCNGLIDEANGHVHYPTPLLNHLMKSMQLPLDSPSGRTSHVPPPEPSLSSPLDRNPSYQGPVNVPYAGGLGSQSHDHSIEKQRANLDQNDIPAEIFMDELNTNIMSNGIGVTEGNLLFTPGNSAADELRSIPSSGSGHGFSSHNIEANLGPSNKKRPRSASKHNSGGLEPVAEENTLHYPHPYFELSQLSENGSAPEQEFLVETGPTQTQPLHSVTNPFIDKIADTIRTQMKSHFDTPGAPQIESLNNLAYGMDRKRAAVLFYQTCVLATHQILKVEQNVPYGDISIARGTKM